MKKSLIALAVAGALTAPMVAQADATLYGSLRIKLVDNDATKMDVQDNFSRIGIRGSSDLFSGAKAIFQFEQAVSTETGAWDAGRLANLGITGDFGTAIFGRIWTPNYNWVAAKLDIMDNGTSAFGTVGPGRVGNVIAYVSPDMNGFQAAAAVIADDSTNDDNAVDISHVAAHYSANGFSAGVSYLDYDAPAVGDADSTVGVAASYAAGDFYVAAGYGRDDIAGGDDMDSWGVAASYTIGNTTLLANYGDDDSEQQASFEVQQKLGEQARVFVAVADYDGAADTGFEVGYRVDF